MFFKLGTRNVHHKRNQIIPMVLLSWKLSWLQSQSVRNQISSFSTFESRTDGPVWSRHGNHMVLFLTTCITLARADCPWTKTGNAVLIKIGLAAELLSWQQHNRCHFVSFVINISGAKFEKHCFNISRDILCSVFCNLFSTGSQGPGLCAPL